MSGNKAEFHVDATAGACDGVSVEGRVTVGNLRIDDVFDLVCHDVFEMTASGGYELVRRNELRRVTLLIKDIVSYRHHVDGLSSGMTGQLILVGDGVGMVRAKDTLVRSANAVIP
jgi:hypothetical protein